jgi:hypothetical protein
MADSRRQIHEVVPANREFLLSILQFARAFRNEVDLLFARIRNGLAGAVRIHGDLTVAGDASYDIGLGVSGAKQRLVMASGRGNIHRLLRNARESTPQERGNDRMFRGHQRREDQKRN